MLHSAVQASWSAERIEARVGHNWSWRLDKGLVHAVLALLLGCFVGCLSGCETSASLTRLNGPDESAIEVVATVGMVADLVRNVGGPHVRVIQLMGQGVDPHLYKVTRDDVRAIFAGDVIFYSGLMLEGKMTHTLRQMASRKPVIGVAEGLPRGRLIGSDDSVGHAVADDHPDPHVWMDVSMWADCLEEIVETLSAWAPQHRDDFQLNAQRYRDELMALHQYGLESIKTIPPQRRWLITSHDAFSYFGRAYGLDVAGVQGLSTDSEAGLMRINQLVDAIVQRRIAAVFVESSVPRKSIEAVIDGARSRGHRVMIGGELYSDSGGPQHTYEGTYVGMMDHNFTLITRGLGGSAPAAGFQGRLSGHDAATGETNL